MRAYCPGCPTDYMAYKEGEPPRRVVGPSSVPCVTPDKANELLIPLRYEQRMQVVEASIAWLEQKHPGLQVYAGIASRPYLAHEKDAIAMDAETCAGLPCPYFESGVCMLEGVGDLRVKLYLPGITRFGWLPTLALRLLVPERLRELAMSGHVADVKIAMLNRPSHFPTRGNILRV